MAEKAQPGSGAPDVSSSVPNSFLRRILTRASIAFYKNRRKRNGSVLFLSPRICVKYGPTVHVAEAVAMKYIATHTSIPVPKVYCAFERNGISYIVMSTMPGKTVADVWSNMSDRSQIKVLDQLRKYVDEMRELDPPRPHCVEGTFGGQLFDPKLPEARQGYGPFPTLRKFHSYLRLGMDRHSPNCEEVNDLMDWHEKECDDYATCFTHGDLCSSNILVSGGNISGIVDWESAGWLPEYWEYTSAWNVNMFNVFWRFELERFLHVYEDEREMEHIRLKHFANP
ncbi:MAG: hypothetical protein M1820_000890 [Bogoriella megaspora]|nr:MAG: hypothetical protein M1820_000890 [Bogoriella megaspora]